MGRPYLALAVGFTGKAPFSINSRLHWEGLIQRLQKVALGHKIRAKDGVDSSTIGIAGFMAYIINV